MKGRIQLYEEPLYHCENKFVITEDRAYFVPVTGSLDGLSMVDILASIFDLEDEEVVREVDGKLFGGRLILGYFDSSTKEVIVHSHRNTSDYLAERIKDVFGI